MIITFLKRTSRIVMRIMMMLWRLPITPIGLLKGTQAGRRVIGRATRKTTARARRKAKRFLVKSNQDAPE